MSDKATIRNLRTDLENSKNLAAQIGKQNLQLTAQLKNMLTLLIAITEFHGKPMSKAPDAERFITVPTEVFNAIDTNKLALNVAQKEEVEVKGEKVIRDLAEGKIPIIRVMVVPRPPMPPEQMAKEAQEEKRPLDIPTMTICQIHKTMFPKGIGCAQCLADYARATGAKIRPLNEKVIEITDKE